MVYQFVFISEAAQASEHLFFFFGLNKINIRPFDTKKTRLLNQKKFRPSFVAKLSRHEILSGVGFESDTGNRIMRWRLKILKVNKGNSNKKSHFNLFFWIISNNYYSWKWISALKKDPHQIQSSESMPIIICINALSIDNFTLGFGQIIRLIQPHCSSGDCFEYWVHSMIHIVFTSFWIG